MHNLSQYLTPTTHCTAIKIIFRRSKLLWQVCWLFVFNFTSLNQLLFPGTKWHWSTKCARALSQVKKKLSNSKLLVHFDSKLLVHYDSTLPLTLATDASHYGVGAVISHVYPNGTEHPIAFASRTLSKAEQNYPQIEKVALSIIFCIKSFISTCMGDIFH